MAQRQWRSDDTDKWKEAFGDGSDGSTYVVPANEGCSSSLGVKTLTLADAGSFANDDLILIHQTRGTNAGHWELNRIVSGGGTTTLTLKYDTTLAYADSGNDQAQVIELHQYDGLTTGSITAPAWDGSKGGILAWFDKGTCTVDGTLDASGNGFRGANLAVRTVAGRPRSGWNGEGYTYSPNTRGAGQASSDVGGTVSPDTPHEDSAGSGGRGSRGHDAASGGGGGHASTGTNGSSVTTSPSFNGGYGGYGCGNSSLTSVFFGGGGGACSQSDSTDTGKSGGNGGGIIFIFSKNIIVSGSININGESVGNSGGYHAGGGGGAGGSCLLKCSTATLGSSKITATGGSGGGGISSSATAGGSGSVGRIHLDYSKSYTGSTNPTLDATLDTTIKTTTGIGNFLAFF